MSELSSPIALLGFLAFALLLSVLDKRLPLQDILKLIESNGRESTALIAFGLFLGFLINATH